MIFDRCAVPPVLMRRDDFLFYTDREKLARDFAVGLPTLQLIIDGLRQPTDYDIRASKSRAWSVTYNVGCLGQFSGARRLKISRGVPYYAPVI